MVKKVLKTLWISALSTVMKLLAQTLTKSGFGELPKLGTVPIEYLVINFIVFASLTVLFIFIVDYIPTYKLLKGVLYSLLISFVWTALIFQPQLFEDFRGYIINIGVFLIPMVVYGAFLGYLSTEKKNHYKFSKDDLKYLIISLLWLVFHMIFVIFIPPMRAHFLNYAMWLLTASVIIGFIFGFFYHIHIESKYNTLLISSIIVAVVFFSFYIDRYATGKTFEWAFFIRLLLDIISVVLSLQVIELYTTKKTLFGKLGKRKIKEEEKELIED